MLVHGAVLDSGNTLQAIVGEDPDAGRLLNNALVAELSRLVEELIRKGRNVAIQVMLLTQRATGDAIPTRIRDNCQVAISFATRTLDGAVAALGEEIGQHPDASPVQLNDPAYVGVAATSLPGRPGFQRVRTPQVDHHQVAAIIRSTAGLRADPTALLPPAGQQAPGLRVVPTLPTPGDAARPDPSASARRTSSSLWPGQANNASARAVTAMPRARSAAMA